MNNDDLIAHVKQNPDGSWAAPQSLEAHLRGTAELAGEFAAEFGNGDWARVAAFLHDLGKGSENFQKYIRGNSGYDAHIENMPGKVNHSSHGAVWAKKNWPEEKFGFLWKIFAYLIAGHHAGLPDWFHELNVGGDLVSRMSEEEQRKLPELAPAFVQEYTKEVAIPKTSPCGEKSIEAEEIPIWIRMLFSCLVDADFLDTERYMSPDKSDARGQYPNLKELKALFDNYMADLTRKADPTDVNVLRSQILAECRNAGKQESGFFTLNVPTGGGKTLSSMAFALEHAVSRGKERVIMVIPYTSIIEQTAKEYKTIFGEENVIEHHSSLDPDNESWESRLAAENWDAPIVVTTNVQFFESLFAAKTSACRKLHNICNSVVILDEVQMLPADYLKPVLAVMNSLVKFFGTSLVLCSATQPVLTGMIGTGQAAFSGLKSEDINDIIARPLFYARKFQRVKVHSAGKFDHWKDLAQRLEQCEQVLCVVNTRNDCRDLFRSMPPGTVHLSANMCGEHRSSVIEQIKKDLQAGRSIRVISTQLVEAGVDLDFPVVYRAMAGFDSIAQAAGRCNREGKLKNAEGAFLHGDVFVFEGPKAAPPGMLRQGEQAGKEMFSIDPEGAAILHPETLKKYFQLFYAQRDTFDRKDIQNLLVKNAAPDLHIQFRTAAQRFQLIDDARQVSVVVKYNGKHGSSEKLISTLSFAGPSRTLMRKLQRFSISLPERVFHEVSEAFEEIHGIYCQSVDSVYDDVLGFVGYDGEIPIL